jgi:hypothetical protein
MTRWLVIAALGCGGHPAPAVAPAPPPRRAVVVPAAPPVPLPLDQDLARLAQRSVAMYQALATALYEVGDSCAAGATKLDELTAKFDDVVAANAKVVHDGRGAELRAALAPHEAELASAARSVMGSSIVAHCAQDAAFTAAFDRFVGGPS